ncbi:hypothetical protein CVT26_006795 [Gymnopilus dilepis]|uniref:Uncharacterized protein n=1 Tax=Gymnopilus dilepis TaxID=231916 RepID=A0A409Y380_9AGAR|nr:hypothetical protein CVT26_006795 [Gymnopilus dilepis]
MKSIRHSTVLSLTLIWLCASTATPAWASGDLFRVSQLEEAGQSSSEPQHRRSTSYHSTRWHDTWTRVWRRASSSSSSSSRNVPPAGFYPPGDGGGSMLTSVPNTFPAGQGEPINVILSGNSDEAVLVDQEIFGGLRNYFLSIGFSGECLGQHSGSDQEANLGDGHGFLNETAVIRWDYGDPQLGTCQETIQGGNHFRYWVQNGPSANSGAIFMALSYELPISLEHDIVPNGYNLARDYLIGNITHTAIPTANLTNGTTFSGDTSSANYTYHTDILYVTGLLPNTSVGINHNLTVGVDGVNAADGLVAILDVKITSQPKKSFAWRTSPPLLWHLPSVLPLMVLILLPTSFLVS